MAVAEHNDVISKGLSRWLRNLMVHVVDCGDSVLGVRYRGAALDGREVFLALVRLTAVSLGSCVSTEGEGSLL